MGTMRLAFAFGAGFVGVLFLVLAMIPLVTGKIEAWPTALPFERIDSEGFPSVWYLTVSDGFLVLSEADVRLRETDGPEPELFRVTVPVVSESVLKEWQESAARGEPIDAANLRLFASFNREQVRRLWPEAVEQVESGHALDLPPERMALTGDTVPAKFMVYKPHDFKDRTKNFDWERMRWLRFGRHFQSPARFTKNLLFGIGLLAVSVLAFGYHRGRVDDVSENVFDLSALPTGSSEPPDPGDIDLDM